MTSRITRVSLLSLALAGIAALAFLASSTQGVLDSILEPVSVLGFLGIYFGWAVSIALPALRSKAAVAVISILPNALLYSIIVLGLQAAVRAIRQKRDGP